ncbi:MAG: nicotinamide mononucleotide transporter [Saprospirales bacterium]|nr:nicotinamide mononucleotide transporter [Saprospirales bacterium]MBK8923285.1 nicotinamide mononucleotide transporter [Saprospirales bacterium]
MDDLWQQLAAGLLATTWLEFAAVLFGIASVLFSRMENIWVYPTGLVNTTIYIYLSVVAGLYAEAGVNFYYTVMSIAGWILWARKTGGQTALHITRSSCSEWQWTLAFFFACWAVLYLLLDHWTDSTVPLADGLASAAAYTGMLLMTRKKLENWLWWILTNLAAMPLYFFKGFVFTAFQYAVFLLLAVSGYIGWRRKLAGSATLPATSAPARQTEAQK